MKKIIIGFTLLLTLSASVYALSVVTEGWKVGKSKTVKIDLVANYGSGNCKNVSSSTYDIFVPTANITEWNAFKNNAPNNNIGVTLANCSGGVVNGACSSTPVACSAGSVSGDNGNTLPGGTRLWSCLGSGGGTNASCSYTNPPASCVPNGTYTYGSCSASCGGGLRDRYDSCGNYDGSETCNTQACSCTPTSYSAWSSCSVSCGGGTQTRTDNCGGTESQPCNTQACSTTGPYTYGAWGSCSVSCGGGTQTRTETCSYDTCTGQQATSQSCNTQSCGPVMGHWQYSYTEPFYATHCGGIDPVPSGSCTVGNSTIRFIEACADPAGAEIYDCVP